MVHAPLLIALTLAGADPDDGQEAIRRGVVYLLAHQAEDGSWGQGEGYPKDIPGQEHPVFDKAAYVTSYRIAGTCLVYQALLRSGMAEEARVKAALDQVEPFLLKTLSAYPPRDPKKPFDRSVWVNVYGLSALCDMRRRHGDDSLGQQAAAGIRARLQAVAATQLHDGGWHYANIVGVAKAVMRPKAKRPPFQRSASTSFLTALHVLALRDAQAAGAPVEPSLLTAAGQVLLGLKSPKGGFLYSNRRKALHAPHNRLVDYGLKGSLGRLALCSLALAEVDLLPPEALETAAEQFIRHHDVLDPVYGKGGAHHPKLHNNASYFWLFGYAYTGELARRLTGTPIGQRLRALVTMKVAARQNTDGSWQDGPNLGKAYGTAMAILALSNKPLFRRRPSPTTAPATRPAG